MRGEEMCTGPFLFRPLSKTVHRVVLRGQVFVFVSQAVDLDVELLIVRLWLENKRLDVSVVVPVEAEDHHLYG